MEPNLEQLIQKRKNLIKAHQENDFTDGIHALLTDLYPDTAHFIYELLQNAEDMRATTVRFILSSDRIDFEHNGSKRTFNIHDIDAITNIGHNRQKKDDPTSIGKFGVGFKAVFAYTKTPIIHSGDYHFMICDYFVPEFIGVPKVATIDPDGVSWTKFSFPFNNPKKSPVVAYAECLDGLKALDSSAVLFLQHINRIEYMLPTGGVGYVERNDTQSPRITISYEKPKSNHIETSHWLRFDRFVEITDDQGKNKNLPIAVAFAVGKDQQTKREKIVSVQGGGKTFIYFPAEKEYSGLRFHINAPFASTVARDSVRDCTENTKLIRAISSLLVDSLPYIKENGFMNHSFFDVLPNHKDGLSLFYSYVFDYVVSAFMKNKYLPSKNGGYITSCEGLMGPAAISNLFTVDDMRRLARTDKVWILNAPQKNSNADHFIRSLSIEEFTQEQFSQFFEVGNRSSLEKLFSEKNKDWLRRFYVLCADVVEEIHYKFHDIIVQNMKQTRMLQSSTGPFYRSNDIYILPPNVSLVTKSTPIIDQEFLMSRSRSENKTDRIRSFLKYELDVREYGPKIEIEKLLSKYAGAFDFSEEYLKDILSFAKYSADHSDIDFTKEKIFFFRSPTDGKLYGEKACNMYLGKAYGNEAGDVLSSAYNAKLLWDGYSKHYQEKDLSLFVSFVGRCGIKKSMEIVEQYAGFNPLFSTHLKSHGTVTHKCISYDYTIPELEVLLNLRSKKINEIIWYCLEQHGRNIYKRYHIAQYAPNASAPTKQCDSTLIYLLKKYPWIPDKYGELRLPEDISVSELASNLRYSSDNKLLGALKLGSANEKRNQKRVQAEKAAKEAGMRVIPEEDYQKYEQWKAQQEKKSEVPPLSSQELLKKQKKKSVPNPNDGDDFTTDGAVNNVARRETNIENTFRNAKQMKPAQRQLFGRIMESTKAERKTLRYWYQGSCQMCGTRILGHDQKAHFIAKNIIDTRHLSAAIRQTTSLAWNSLCLCPNCAMRYDVCSRDLNGLYEQIMEQEVFEGDVEKFVLTIELDRKTQEIHYIPKHFLALKKVMQLIDEEMKV